MPTHDAANQYFSGQGVLMIGRRDPTTGEPIGLRPVGNVPDAKITTATTVLDHKGSQDGQRATDHRLQTEVKLTLSFTLENFSSVNLAKAVRGDETEIAAGSVTNEALVGYPGLVTGFAHMKVSNVVLTQSATTLVAFVDADTPWDYKLNAEAGSIMINDGVLVAVDELIVGSPADSGVTLAVDYSYEAYSLVGALTQPLVDNWVRFEGLNTADENKPVVIDVFRFQNDPLKELAMLNDAYWQGVIEGSVLKDDTRQTGSKYFRIRKQEA